MSPNHTASGTVRSTSGYCGIDLVKFLCSFLVVAIHYPPFTEVHFQSWETMNFVLTQVLARIAVPFFFLSTGFFLLGTNDGERVLRYSLKILRIFGAWTLVLILGSQGHLWYLRATVVAVLCVSFCLRRMKFPMVCVLGLVLYVIGLLGDSYYGLLEPLRSFGPLDALVQGYQNKFVTTRNGVFLGFPFVLMGAWFARSGFTMKPLHAALGLIVSLVGMVAEALTLEKYGFSIDHNMFLMLLPAAFFLFSLAVSLPLRPRPVYVHMRSVGALIYYVHIMVAKLVAIFINLLIQLCGVNLYPYLYPLIAAASLLTAVLIYRLSRRERFLWLQYLYR